MNNKVKAFYQKHEAKFIIAGLALCTSALIVTSIALAKSTTKELSEEDWDQLMDLARQMDEIAAKKKR